MLVADGMNITASVGAEGVLLVNTGAAAMSDKVLAALGQLAQRHGDAADGQRLLRRELPRTRGAGPAPTSTPSSARRARRSRCATSSTPAPTPSTSAATRSCRRPASSRAAAAFGTAVTARRAEGVDHRARERAEPHERTGRQAGGRCREAAWPTDTYFDEFHKLPAYFNGEAVIIYHAPAANTDGDSFVFFRRSEVISAGNLFSTVSYPVIDLDKGGTHPGRARRPEQDPRSGGGRVPRAGRHLDRARRAAGCRIRPTWRRTATC